MPRSKKGLAGLKIQVPRRQGTSRPPTPKVDKVSGAPIYSGFVQGLKASTPEEMLARVLDKYGKTYTFRYKIPAMTGIYGLRGEKEIDFVVYDGNLKPVQVADEEFVHHSPEQKEKDRQSDIICNDYFKDYGGVPVVWINAVILATVDGAELEVRRLGLI